MFTICLVACSIIQANWYAGKWDSNIYNRSEKPRTVGVRIEVIDAETYMPIQGAQVTLYGEYMEEWVGSVMGVQDEVPTQPQRKEFELRATTDSRGIVVFTLSWQKEYPWDVPSPSFQPSDDVEKVQRIEIRHRNYNYQEIPFSFKHLLNMGQEEKYSSGQTPEAFNSFDEAWVSEIRKDNVLFCVLDLGIDFPDFKNTESMRPEFFLKIHNKAWGTQYQEPYNIFSYGEYPQSECGPYLIYNFEDIGVERLKIYGRERVPYEPGEFKHGKEPQLTEENWHFFEKCVFLPDEMPEGFELFVDEELDKYFEKTFGYPLSNPMVFPDDWEGIQQMGAATGQAAFYGKENKTYFSVFHFRLKPETSVENIINDELEGDSEFVALFGRDGSMILLVYPDCLDNISDPDEKQDLTNFLDSTNKFTKRLGFKLLWENFEVKELLAE